MDAANVISFPPNIYGLIAIFAFIISAILFIRRNDIKGLREANDDLRKRIDDKSREYADLVVQITALRADVDKYKAIAVEKDKRIDALEHIQVIQQVSPEQLAYMGDMKNFANNVNQYMGHSLEILTRIDTKGNKRAILVKKIKE